jgi:hypothetical protein
MFSGGLYRLRRRQFVTHFRRVQCGKNKCSDSENFRSDATDVQWVSFTGFYQRPIIKEFVESAMQHSLTGFLAHGKPAVACLEGKPEDIHEFLRHVRTNVFATVPRSARKMTLGLRETLCPSAPRFANFDAISLFSTGSHHRSDMLDRGQLEVYLRDHGVPEQVRASVLGRNAE